VCHPTRFSSQFAFFCIFALLKVLGGCASDSEQPNRPPVIASISADPVILFVDSLATVWVEATDPDDDPLDYAWSATAGSFPEGAESSTVSWRAPGAAGTCTLSVVVNDGAATARDTLTIDVSDPHPLLAVTLTQLRFSIAASESVFSIQNTGTGRLDWTIDSESDWLTAVPANGSTTTESDEVFVTIDRTTLTAGTYYETIDIFSNGGDETVVVTVEVVEETVFTYRIVEIYNHDSDAFTQGLVFENGVLLEGTGLYGESSLRRVELETGNILQIYNLPAQYFGEGITIWEDSILQLTYRSHTGLVYDKNSFTLEDQFSYTGEGWGLTHDGSQLIMSDGTATLRFLDPVTYGVTRTLPVSSSLGPIYRLNELEYVQGMIYANIWFTDRIVQIDPVTGQVTGWIDCTGLLDQIEGAENAGVLNGIAFDALNDRLFVTGKNWPRLFEIELVPVNPTLPLVPRQPREECTIGVASGFATFDGRPLLWKSRDTTIPDHEVFYNTSYQHRFIAVVNANGEPESEAWMGVNEHGFAILNANSNELASRAVTRHNGEFMRDALGTCYSVAEFVALLDSTNSLRETHANFGVFDSTGAAFMFEASPDTYWTYDAQATSDGFIVRTNFACNDTAGTGIEGRPGAERFLRSTELITELVSQEDLSCASLLRNQMRDFAHQNGAAISVPCYSCGQPDSLYGFINSYWSICRNISTSVAIIHGVKPIPEVKYTAENWEPAYLSTMWVLLGHPTTGIAVPYWPVGPAPALADGDSTAPLCDRARAIRKEIFRYWRYPHLLDSFRLLDGDGGGFWSQTFPAEEQILAETRIRLDRWRIASVSWINMLGFEESMAEFAYDVLMTLTPVQENDLPGVAAAALLRQNYPNPFNAGTVIPYEVPQPALVDLAVYDSCGRRIVQLVRTFQATGRHTVTWDANSDGMELASGTYFLQLTIGEQRVTRKCVYVK